jgi:hypothetical protein
MSNNFDGPVLLDSRINNAAEPGYFGTGGRNVDASVGPFYSGGVLVDAITSTITPALGSIFISVGANGIPATFMWNGDHWVGYASVPLNGITNVSAPPAISYAMLTEDGPVAAANTVTFTAPGLVPTPTPSACTILATVQVEDTGGTLGGIQSAVITGLDTVEITTNNNAGNGDSIISVVVFLPGDSMP